MGYDFESDKQYNVEKYVSMTIELKKTCYSPGEMVYGTIILRANQGLQNPLLSSPLATLYLTEYFYYTYSENEYNPHKKMNEFVSKVAEENMPLLKIPLDFRNFLNANIMNNVAIPFQFQIPVNIYPSVIFDTQAYVKHYLCIDFPSIMAKKTVVIVIKNNLYFSIENALLQQPAVCFREVKKHKLFASKGSFNATLKLERNTFSYSEMIPFEVDVDATKLSMNVKGIKISLHRTQKKNLRRDHNKARDTIKKEVASKSIPFRKGDKRFHIEDVIQLKPEYNPKQAYNLLDSDHRKYSEKYNNVRISPTCYGGLLSCDYYIKLVVEMDSLLSTDEDLRIPIDLYEPFVGGGYGAPQQPYPQQPYPQAGQQPYPPTGNQPYPQAGQQPYPQAGQQPYPPTGNQPYPQAGQQQYPQQQYPQQQYPPQQVPPQQYPPQQVPPQQYPPQQVPPRQYPPQQVPPQQYPPQQVPPQQYPPQQVPPRQYPPQQYPPQQVPPQNAPNSYPNFNNGPAPSLNQMIQGK